VPHEIHGRVQKFGDIGPAKVAVSTRRVAVPCLMALACAACTAGADLPAGVTADRVLMLRPGMTYEEVTTIVGPPVRMETELPRHREGSMDVVHRQVPTANPFGDRVVLTFSRPVRFAMSYPMLWVTLEKGRVTDIYAKRYDAWGLDSEGVYWYREGKDPWGGGADFRELFSPSPARR